MTKIFTRLVSTLALIAVISSMAFAQGVTISGTVTDKTTNETLAGVAVSVKGKSVGTSSNENGKFSFTTTEATPFTLVVSYLGYKTI